MGVFDWFGGDAEAKVLRKHGPRAANKRAYPPDRWESIQAIAALKSEAGVEALLKRFEFTSDPSITDQEEKEAAFQGVLEAGPAALAPLRRFLRQTHAVAWGIKCLDRLLPETEATRELLDLLASMSTEYERDPQKKIEVLASLSERQDAGIAEAVKRFLEDVNETVRFHAVDVLLSGGRRSELPEPLLTLLLREESVRIRVRIAEAMQESQWRWAEGTRVTREQLTRSLPPGFSLGKSGRIERGA